MIKDEMTEVYKMIDKADNLIIASPIYFGNLTGSLLNWASRLQLFWVQRHIRKIEPISIKQRKGAVILVCGSDKSIEPAIFSGKDLLIKAKAECCDILDIRMTEVEHKPVLTDEHIQKMKILAKILNER